MICLRLLSGGKCIFDALIRPNFLEGVNEAFSGERLLCAKYSCIGDAKEMSLSGTGDMCSGNMRSEKVGCNWQRALSM